MSDIEFSRSDGWCGSRQEKLVGWTWDAPEMVGAVTWKA